MKKPVIFTAFANPKEDLRQLKEEEKALINLFLPLNNADKVQHFNRPNLDIEQLYKDINQFHRRILIFHYGGHAEDHLLFLDDKPNYAEGLAKALASQQKNLLIFLNGCSTQSQVEKLVEAGARAVIATTEKIKDGLSKAFAEAFYEQLIAGKTLQDAFEDAQPVALGISGDDLSFKTLRGSLDLDDEEEGAKFPWFLYVKYEDQLQWKLEEDYFDPDYLPDPVEMVLAQKQEAIETLREAIHNLEIEIAKSHDKIKRFEKFGDEFKDLIKEETNKIDTLGKQILEKEEAIQREDEELRTEKREAELSESQKLLQQELERINYKDQFDAYRDHVNLENNLGAFVIQGTPLCGLGFLRDRLLKKASVQFSFSKVVIDFAPLSTEAPDEKTIWKTIARYFKLDENLATAEIVETIFTKGHLRYKHLLLLFENLNYPDVEFNIRLIKEFWFVFQTEALLHNTSKNNPDGNKTLLFISDVNCRNKESGSSIPKAYLEKIEADMLKQKHAFVLPIVEILQLEDLRTWSNQLPDDLGLSEAVFQTIIDNYKGFLLPTIKAICEHTQTQQTIYNENFAKYE